MRPTKAFLPTLPKAINFERKKMCAYTGGRVVTCLFKYSSTGKREWQSNPEKDKQSKPTSAQ